MGRVLSVNFRIISIMLQLVPFFNLHKQINILDGTNADQRPFYLRQSRDNTFEVAKVARSLRCLISKHREHVEIVMNMYTARIVSSAG